MKKTKLSSILTNVENFMNKSTAGLHELQELNEKLTKEVEKEDLTQKRKQEIYHKRYTELYNSLTDLQNSDNRTIERVYSEQVDLIKEKEEPITADINAELDALSKIQLTDDIVKEYADKYSSNKLAFLRIQKIASEQGFSVPITYKMDDQINELDEFKNVVQEQYKNSKHLIDTGMLSKNNNNLDITNDIELNVIKNMARDYENEYHGNDN